MSTTIALPVVSGTVKQVLSGELFSGLLLDGSDQRALALEAVLRQVVDDDTRLIWIGNPLRSPLTIERFLIQIVGPAIDLREERGPAELAGLIAGPAGDEKRLLVVVQQPETIDPETRDLLVAMGEHLGEEAVQVQFLFAGSTSFMVPKRAKPQMTALASRLSAAAPQALSAAAPRAPPRRDVLPLVLLLLTLTIGVLISIVPTSEKGIFLAPSSARSPVEVSLLRREFDAFVEQRAASLPPMTEKQKDTLFAELLTYYHHISRRPGGGS